MIFGNLDIEIIVLLIPALVFSLSFHEFAHAWMSFKLGDNTAARLGRAEGMEAHARTGDIRLKKYGHSS